MRVYSDKEVIMEAELFVLRNESVRKTAKLLHMPKSTLYEHIKKRLKSLDYNLWLQAKVKLLERRKTI